MKRRIIVALLLALPAMLTACNTIQGLGQDIKDGGAAMSHAINGNNDDKHFGN